MAEILLVKTTFDDLNLAEKFAEKLLNAKLAACVSIGQAQKSFYFWENKLVNAQEFPMEIKTSTEKFAQLREFIRKNHSYEVPEIIAVSATLSDPDYENWLKEVLG
ncbi:MAG: divalent-cation tolerance protein CutA [Cardiobacteriaceae bacterium]|nr:divalent-cation tolerance protein CutA [Cardiobacteriaceae bacterium]